LRNRKIDHLTTVLDSGVDPEFRRVYLHGDIDEDTVRVAIRGILLLMDVGPAKEIKLIISSCGGSLDESFALHDVIRTCTAPVHTMAVGKCMSATPLLVACGDLRSATENTSFMLHDAHVFPADDNPANLLVSAKVSSLIMDRYAALLAKYTKKRKQFWLSIFRSKVDRYFSAREALEWGVIDEIWK
jgi:ATP-dependent Clp protease, protease subunit